MDKNALRSAYLEKREKLSDATRQQFSLEIANTCLRLPVWNLSVFHLFLSIPKKNEVDTSFLLTVLQGKDKEVVIPKVGPGNLLSHFLLTDSTRLEISKWGVPEPVSGLEIEPNRIEVVFLPLLAFDKRGYRVGYGGGYYDRFLRQCRPEIVKVGLSFFEAESAIPDIHQGDVPMDYCVTPAKIYSF